MRLNQFWTGCQVSIFLLLIWTGIDFALEGNYIHAVWYFLLCAVYCLQIHDRYKRYRLWGYGAAGQLTCLSSKRHRFDPD